MEGDQGATSGQKTYEKEWAEYYARMGWVMPTTTGNEGEQKDPSGQTTADANAMYGAQNPWGAPGQQYPAQGAYPGYPGYGM